MPEKLNTPPRLPLANTPTPFRPLDRLSEHLGGPRLWLKADDCTGLAVSGNKIRKLEFLMAEAQALGAQAVLTCGGVQSNHCRATAAVAAQLGLRCHLILRGPAGLTERATPYCAEELYSEGYEGNLLLDYLFGATVEIYSPRHYATHLGALFKDTKTRIEASGLKPYGIPTGGSNAMGLWGYIAAAEEIQNDMHRHDIQGAAIVCASGSGGTQGGLTLGMQLHNMRLERAPHPVIGFAVCDSAQYFEDKILADVRAWQNRFAPERDWASTLNIHTNEAYIGPGYALGYPELFQCIQTVARLEGVLLDPVYTGKAFYGMLDQIKQGEFDEQEDIIFVHTGGIFGLFPFKDAFKNRL